MKSSLSSHDGLTDLQTETRCRAFWQEENKSVGPMIECVISILSFTYRRERHKY